MSERNFFVVALTMLAGALIWGVHFSVVYGFNAVACSRGLAATRVYGIGVVPLVIGVTTAVCAVAALVTAAAAFRSAARSRSEGWRFVRYTTGMIAGFALLAMAWEALPAFYLPPCS